MEFREKVQTLKDIRQVIVANLDHYEGQKQNKTSDSQEQIGDENADDLPDIDGPSIDLKDPMKVMDPNFIREKQQ